MHKRVGHKVAWMIGFLEIACGASERRSETGEMTVEGHEQAAAQERAAARKEQASFDPNATQVHETVQPASAMDGGMGGILVTVNPTQGHLTAAEAHRRHAAAHAAAAKNLKHFEDEACTGLAEAERESCPTLTTSNLETLPAGVRLHTGTKRLGSVLQEIRCHLAFAKAHGYDRVDLCPFALPGVHAEVANDRAGVDLQADNETSIQALHSLISLPYVN